MNSRLTVLALVAVLLAAFAVPALAKPGKTTGDVQGLSVRALAKARLALLTARSAKSESRRAARTAQAALNVAEKATGPTGATGPVGSVGPVGPTGPAQAAIQSGLAAGAVETDSESYVQLAGGPSVQVQVPASGLIEVWAQATIEEEGTVALFEDGQKVPGQNLGCGVEEEGRGLLASYLEGEVFTLATPGGFSFGPFCGTLGPPSSILFQTTPGPHTYELRYSIGCGCSPDPTFSNRRLLVAPRL